MKNWYDPLRSISSLGSKKSKITNMGQLAEARKIHLAQFFTPDSIVAFMWKFIEKLTFTSILDNSFGSGRMFQFADPGKHELYGVDVHTQTVQKVMKVVEDAGFRCMLLNAGMQDIKPRRMHVGLINPPFSIHLESPNLEAYDGVTTMGKFGANTSAISDQYALRQALRACDIVIALMPTTRALEIVDCNDHKVGNRLRAIYHLPKKSFKDEGTEISTSVLVFGEVKENQRTQIITLNSLPDEVEDWNLDKALESSATKNPTLGYTKNRSYKPSINLPVTGNTDVSVHLDGRKIKLKFQCGLTQAKVLNAILVNQISSTEHMRLPKNIMYSGQGRLDLMSYMIQSEPVEAFEDFIQMIHLAGGNPVLASGLLSTVRKKARETKRALHPFRRTIWSKGNLDSRSFFAVATETQIVYPNNWVSPVIKKGERIHLTKVENGGYQFDKNGKSYELSTDRIESLFDMGQQRQGWRTIYAGKQEVNLQHAELLRNRALKLGIDKWLSWKFQIDDLIEIFMQPSSCGAVVGWEQACGKSRLAAAMILLSGVKHGLIVVESRLVAEMQAMLAILPINQSQVHVINSPDSLSSLKQINIISYETLRSSVTPGGKSTYGKRLRRRIGLVIPDEAEKLCNLESNQSKALFQLSARRKIALTGTPIANYPRDVLGLLLFVGGDSTPVQPYGYHRGFLSDVCLRSVEFTPRGIDQLANDFVVLEWATHEFTDTLSKGAKREVPKIKDVDKFRAWLTPLIKRRVVDEPEVQPYIQLPPIHEKIIELEWCPAHLGHYLKVADEFAQWYRNRESGKRQNLAILLAKIQAVHMALNIPQLNLEYRGGLTSKQKFQIDRLCEIAAEGKKSLLFCNNPGVVDILHFELKKRNVESVRFTGKQSIKSRNAEKESKFKHGDVPILLTTLGCARAGQNLPQADYVNFIDRCWSFRTQDQAIKRPRRTERKEPIYAEFLHLPGSLDIYQAQLIAFKRDATLAGLDYAAPELENAEFLHLTTVLDRFVKNLATRENLNFYDLRRNLKAAA